MKNKLTLLLVSCFLVSGIWLSGNGQTGGDSWKVEFLQKCIQDREDADLRMHNLWILMREYRPQPDSYEGYKEIHARRAAEYFRILDGYRELCILVEYAEWSLALERNQTAASPSPTPTASPSPTASPTPPLKTQPDETNVANVKRLDQLNVDLDGLEKEFSNDVKRLKTSLTTTLANIVKTDIKIAGGLQAITFNAPEGQITVNLPDDIRAGDTISGTVVETPNGRDDKERANNLAKLQEFSIELSFEGVIAPVVTSSGNSIRLLSVSRHRTKGNDVPSCNLVANNGADIIKVPIIVDPLPPVLNKLPVINKLFPTTGQAGRTIEIPGKFDGSLNTTKVKFGEQPVIPVAETPRGIVVSCPTNVTGPIDVTIDENGQITKGTFRNLGVGLTAPNTNLKSGEKTKLTVQVTGLAGIRSDVPLQLVKTGTVTMNGGDTQHIRIRPQDVRSDGTYSLTREITGVLPGGFNVTATVFDPTRRPIVIPLTQGARVNGYEVVMENGKPVLVAGGVIDPLTGKPLDGTHRLQAGCGNPVLSKIPYLSRLFKNGDAKFDKTECLVFITPRIIVE